jgi:hypothetical protein
MNKFLEGRGTMIFRVIHTTWMLLFVTVVFTALVNPITLGRLYTIDWVFFVIPVFMLIAAVVGFFIGECITGRIADSFSPEEELIQKVKILSSAFLGCLLSLALFGILIIMDCVSVGVESYGGISQYSIWYLSLALLIVATLVLAWTTRAGLTQKGG